MTTLAHSVAEPELEPEPELLEQQLFAGAGYINSYKMLQTSKFFILKFEVDFKNHNFIAIYLK
jgi:hypothetical protein